MLGTPDTPAAPVSAAHAGAWLLPAALAVWVVATAGLGMGLRSASPPDAGLGARLRDGWRAAGGRGALLALVALLLAAASLRALRLDAGLWYDEVVTLVEYVRLPALELAGSYTSLNNHVLFSLLARGSTSLLGESAWALRLPAALFGVASVGALFALGLQVAGRRRAFLAAALLAVSYHHVWFSQNARGYTGLLFFGLVGTSLFVEGMRRRSRGLWILYGVTLALALYIHLSGAFLFAAHGLVYAGLHLRARTRRGASGLPGGAEAWPLLGFAWGGLLALALYAPALPQVVQTVAAKSASASAAGGDVSVDTWRNPLWTALELARGLQGGFASLAASAAAAGLGALGLLRYARRDPMACALFVLPGPIAAAAVLALSFHLWPRYFFILIGFAALALVEGAFAAAGAAARAAGRRTPAAEARLGSAAAALLIAASALSLPANYRLPKQDYAGARDFVELRRGPEDAIVTAGLARLPYERYYAPEWRSVERVAELEAVRRHAQATWLVYSFPTYMRMAHPALLERVQRDFELVRTFPGTLHGGDIYVWRGAPGGAAGDAPGSAPEGGRTAARGGGDTG